MELKYLRLLKTKQEHPCVQLQAEQGLGHWGLAQSTEHPGFPHGLHLPPVGFLLGISCVCLLSLKLSMLRNFYAPSISGFGNFRIPSYGNHGLQKKC